MMATLILFLLHGTLVMIIWLFSTLLTIHGMPPPNPVQCNNNTGCILQNSYGAWGDRKDCLTSNIVYPTTEEELLSTVANANKKKLKVKVVTKFSHTIPKLACPSKSQSENTILISTERYNTTIDVDATNLAVTVDAGVGLRAVVDRVEQEGFSLVASPYWEGVSVGGLISTGAHGSSWWGKGGAVHDHVLGLRLIVPAKASKGYAKAINLRGQDQLLRAAKVSLGVLGVISKVTFSLEKGFKRSITHNYTSDDRIEDDFRDHAKKHEFADIQWYPSQRIAVYRIDDRVPLNTTGDGVNDFVGFQSNSVSRIKTIRTTEKSLESARDVNGKCLMASFFVAYKKSIANGLKNNLNFTGYPVIGHQGKMQTSGSCLYSSPTIKDISCAWDPRINGLFFFETSILFSASKFGDFIRDVKKLRDLKPENFCGADIYNGFLIRFIKASDAYLGQSKDSVAVDINYYRADEPTMPRLNEDIWEEIEQMAFLKYKAKPHWGKNRNLAFFNVPKKYSNFKKFVEAKKLLDPQNMFSSEWSDEILFGKKSAKTDGCALEGQCICSEDRHCNVVKGYVCRPGVVYDEARVCRYFTSTS